MKLFDLRNSNTYLLILKLHNIYYFITQDLEQCSPIGKKPPYLLHLKDIPYILHTSSAVGS